MARRSDRSGRSRPKKADPPLASAFGEHEPPFSFRSGSLRLSLERRDGRLVYERASEAGQRRAEALCAGGRLLLCPVEPVSLPSPDTRALLVAFEEPLRLGPRERAALYLSLPLDVGVFLGSGSAWERLDVLGPVRPKLTLYGSPASGLLARYWPSPVRLERPPPDPEAGLLALDVHNTSSGWVTLTRTVLEAGAMRMHWGPAGAALRASMKVLGPGTAETACLDEPLDPGMTPSRELFTGNPFSVTGGALLMMEGL